MGKEKDKQKDANDNNNAENKQKVEDLKQKKGLYYLLFKGGLWQ